jgi:pyruvate/2-oxoglutarate dehydrogenase complex dihydrolipoamide dehydrogenase (E3) component
MIAYLDQQARLLSRAGVDIRLNTALTPELARAQAPDVLIAALGARPVIPPIPGIELPHVLGAEAAYLAPERAGRRVAILGGGLVGIELGLFLSGRGCEVSVVEMAPKLSVHEFSMHTLALSDQIQRRGLHIHLSTRVEAITPAGLTAVGPDGPLSLPADTVIYAVGQAPLRQEALALADCAPEFYLLGDCVIPKNIHAATSVAHRTALDLGQL